jgi:hypothetical protein
MADDILNNDEAASDGKKKRRLFGRGQNKKKEEKTPQAPPPPGDDDDKGGTSLRERIEDLWNAAKIVLIPQLPSTRVMMFMLLAFVAGLLWAYNVDPVRFYDGAPHQMREEFQDQYVIGVAASRLARIYDEEGVASLLERVDDPSQRIERLKERGEQTEAALEEIDDVAANISGQNAPSSGSILNTLISAVLAIGLFVVIAWVVAIVWGLLIGGYVERAWEAIRPKSDEEKAEIERRKKELENRRKATALEKQMQEEAAAEATSDLGAPLMNKPSIYFKGRNYDDSFAIEDADDMFLGETGATKAKTLGDAQELAAVEVWLFDKDDFVKTFTKVFVSEHGYNDPVIMSSLEERVDDRDDIVILKPGTEHTLESENLIVKAKVVDAQPGTNAELPANSHFESLTIQMKAYEKADTPAPATAGGATGAATAGGATLPDVSSYEIGPPPEMPSSSGQRDLSEYEIGPPPEMPSSSGKRDLSEYEIGPPPEGVQPTTPPPPLPQFGDDDEDEDPFGGTGDFTPIGR